MAKNNLHSQISKLLDRLPEARNQQRKADDEVKRLKTELASLTAKLAAIDGKTSASDLGVLVGSAGNAW
jgi:peptidoglycan hydrolase CwlO-like protein